MKINKKIIQELVDYLKEFGLTEIEYSDGTTKVKVSKSSNIYVASSAQPKSLKKDKNEGNDNYVTSPIVGTAYLAPEPGAKTFVEKINVAIIKSIFFILNTLFSLKV